MLFLNSSLSLHDVEDGQQYTLLISEIRDHGNWAAGNRLSLRNTGATIDNRKNVTTVTGAHHGGNDRQRGTRPGPQESAGWRIWQLSREWGDLLLVDGSIRFVNSSVDSAIYQHLGNRRIIRSSGSSNDADLAGLSPIPTTRLYVDRIALVSIAIRAIIVAMTIPAVQGARQAAQAIRCRGQLAQLGQAFSRLSPGAGITPRGLPSI